MIKQSFAWWTFSKGQISAETLIKTAAEIGYNGIEMPPLEVWPIIKEHGLTIVNTQGHPLEPKGLNRRENLSYIRQALAEKLELAKKWGLVNLICFSGDRQGLADDVGLATAVQMMRELVVMAEDAGVQLVLELLNSKVDHPDYQADSIAWGVELVKQVASDKFKLLFDVYHMQVMEGDIIRAIQSHAQHIAHYHTAGNPGRQDLDDAQELYYPAIFRAIKASQFSGYIGHEFSPKADPLIALETAYKLTLESLAD